MDIGEHCWIVSGGTNSIRDSLTGFITWLGSKPHYSSGYVWIVSSEEERDVLLGLGLILGAELNVFVVPLWEQYEVIAASLLPTAFSKIYLYDIADVVHNFI